MAAAASAPSREEMAAHVFQQELRTVIHWFTTWNHYERQDFMTDLVNKAIPADVRSLFEALETLKVNDKPPSIFQCQLKLFSEWFAEWSDEERDVLVHRLEELAPEFMNEVNVKVHARLLEQVRS
ncbi:uncharacterized protein C14orf119-like [Patiria miniata]|uniref:Uncharacterized protein n=1 Tax=Patiria miniata TaxID=46514 RepID=A0A914BCK8_PATMI|nr:uncharacterized protein C14orf119-like [Patiria miniata]XP_038073745.1 uncharacterized protein C14orf119-like [Patiria miniata]XP_038073746.1 uncharacterized protein C14orf119-like [Patiria miniata]